MTSSPDHTNRKNVSVTGFLKFSIPFPKKISMRISLSLYLSLSLSRSLPLSLFLCTCGRLASSKRNHDLLSEKKNSAVPSLEAAFYSLSLFSRTYKYHSHTHTHTRSLSLLLVNVGWASNADQTFRLTRKQNLSRPNISLLTFSKLTLYFFTFIFWPDFFLLV